MRTLLRSARILKKNWKLTAIAIFSLSVAMALAVVSLGVSNTSLLAPPPGVAPDRLVQIYSHTPEKGVESISYPDYEYYRENNRVFSDVAAVPESVTMTTSSSDDGAKETLIETMVSGNYFSVLGVRPFLGRFFEPGDDEGKPSLAVMTYTCWARLGSDPNILGTVIDSKTIIGVAPKDFGGYLFGLDGDIITLLSPQNASAKRDSRDLVLLGRLKPGATRSQAQADMTLLSEQLGAAYPKEDKDRSAIVMRATLMPPDAMSTAEFLVSILLVLILLVLLIACANVANLLLALAVGRRQEATIKRALGAPRGRLIREFLCESVIVCAASGVLGYVIAFIVSRRYANFNLSMPMLGSYSFHARLDLGAAVIAGTAVLMLIAILATGLPAALYASSTNLAQALSGEIVVGGTRKAFRRNALVVAQITVCTLVLVGMGLCERSIYNLRHVDVGFTAKNLLADMLLPGDEGFSEARGKQVYAKVREAVSALPGIESVSLSSALPLIDDDTEPVQPDNQGTPTTVGNDSADGNYFATFGIRLLAGRVFDATDTETSPEVVVINRKMAEVFWPGQSAVGHTVLVGKPAKRETIVGVVANGKYGGLDEEPQPFIYQAFDQSYQRDATIVARTKGEPTLWANPIAQIVKDAGLQTPMRPFTYESWKSLSILPQRIIAGCVTGLSALGLLLAIVGLFGAISYSVSERKKELGIRVALGARPWQLMKMIFRQTLLVAGAGTAVGLVLGVAATILLRAQFFGIGNVELSVLIPVGAAMLSVSLAVAYVSARRWITVDPMEAVRHA